MRPKNGQKRAGGDARRVMQHHEIESAKLCSSIEESSFHGGFCFERLISHLKQAEPEQIKDLLSTLRLPCDLRLAAEHRKPIARRLRELGATTHAIGRALGVAHTTVCGDLGTRGSSAPKPKANGLETKGADNADGANALVWTTLSPIQVVKSAERSAAKKSKRGRRLANGNYSAPPPELRVGDFRDVLSDTPPDSVDLIFTDPPYEVKSIDLYGELARFAAKVLRPGGSLLVYCSPFALPELIELLCAHLSWHWLVGAYNGSGPFSRIHARDVLAAYRPIGWLVKPPRPSLQHMVFYMVCREPKPDKMFDSWSQPLKEARYYIDALTEPGDLVVDPMAGAGTTVLAARQLGRRVIAAEIDPKVIAAMSARLASHEGQAPHS